MRRAVALRRHLRDGRQQRGRSRSRGSAVRQCDAILLVLALSARAARESARLIRTGHPGFDLVPPMFALLAIAEAPAELREGYTRIIRAVAPESARAALEELMMTHLKDDFIDGFLDQGRAEGRAQGVAQGEAHILLRIMAARGLAIPDNIRGRGAECV